MAGGRFSANDEPPKTLSFFSQAGLFVSLFVFPSSPPFLPPSHSLSFPLLPSPSLSLPTSLSIKLASRRFLAGSLGFSAGVMLYVSFVEIFVKSQIAFAEALPDDPGAAYAYATLSFFLGGASMVFSDMLVAKLEGAPHSHGPKESITSSSDSSDAAAAATAVACACCAADNDEVDGWVSAAEVEIRNEGGEEASCFVGGGNKKDDDASLEEGAKDFGLKARKNLKEKKIEGSGTSSSIEAPKAKTIAKDDTDTITISPDGNRNSSTPNSTHDKKLVRMGLSTALSIAIHNFPEGLATYVAAIDDPKVGATLALAIAVHNVPEGLCVSIPIYYATGDRKKAFWYGIASGLTEPIGALFGYWILADAMSQITYGIMFGAVAGMMTRISLKELIPTAHRYDPEDTIVTNSCAAGMLVMAGSLVMFQFI